MHAHYLIIETVPVNALRGTYRLIIRLMIKQSTHSVDKSVETFGMANLDASPFSHFKTLPTF